MNENGNPITLTNSGTNVPNIAEIEWQMRHGGQAYNNTLITYGNTTTTLTSNMYGEKILLGVEIGEITITMKYKQLPNFVYASYPPSYPPAKVWKEVYGLKDGRMTLLEVINGKHNPSYTVEESYDFDDEVDVKVPKE